MAYIIYIADAPLEEGIGGRIAGLKEVDQYTEEDADRLLVSDPKAPDDGSSAAKKITNRRMPSYSTWADFLDYSELYDIFHDPNHGLMRTHPGAYQFDKHHCQSVLIAYEDCLHNKNDDPMGHLDRLKWLGWWMQYGLKNFKTPAIINS